MCRTKQLIPKLLNCICSPYHILSTAQIISYNDLQFYAITVILIFCNFSKRNIKLLEDDAETPQHVGAFVI